MKEFSLVGFATYLGGLHEVVEKEIKSAAEDAAVIIETEAKRVIGTYEYGWAPLKPATIAAKTTGDSPLLETGELRDSIEHTVSGHEAQIGSNNDKAVWHELGTAKIPPRSFLLGAATHKMDEVLEKTGRHVHAALTGTSVTP